MKDRFFYFLFLFFSILKILTPEDCGQKNLSLSETNICRSYLDSNVLLTWHSAENFADYCLAYIFAARDFGDGTLGLAWMGSVASSKKIPSFLSVSFESMMNLCLFR